MARLTDRERADRAFEPRSNRFAWITGQNESVCSPYRIVRGGRGHWDIWHMPAGIIEREFKGTLREAQVIAEKHAKEQK